MNFVLDDMEVTSDRETDTPEVANLRRKEISLKPDGSNTMDWPGTSPQVYIGTQTLDGQIVNRCIDGSESMCNNDPSYRADTVDLVEELILKNSDNSNLLVTGGSCEGTQKGQYQLGGGSEKGTLHGGTISKDKQLDTSVSAEAVGNMSLPVRKDHEQLICRQSNEDRNKNSDPLTNSNNNNTISSNSLLFSGGIRTKFLSASGNSHFLVKNSLKGKGVVCRYPVTRDGFGVAGMGQNSEKVAGVARVASDASLNLNSKADDPSPKSIDGGGPYSLHEAISLADWLKPGCRTVDKVESLCIFGKILHIVDLAHSQQIVLQDLRPSCFKLLPSNQVKYVGSLGQKELFERISDLDIPLSGNRLSTKRNLGESIHAYPNVTSKHQKLNENIRFAGQHHQFPARSGFYRNDVSRNNIVVQDSGYNSGERHTLSSERRPRNTIISNRARPRVIPSNVQLEDKWYTSPEELHERGSTFSTNIYCLGILLFELLCRSESWEVHTTTMLKLHHRILPPNFLSENPKEAGFCLWLLHPEPSSRPTTREILQSELMCKSQELLGDQLPLSVDEDDTESELLLQFLVSLKEQKHQHASKLVEDIESLQTDIQEVEKRHLSKTNGVLSLKQSNSSNTREHESVHKEPLNTEALLRLAPVSDRNETRLTRNINQLENAYFSMRSQIQHPDTHATTRLDKDLLKNRSKSSPICIEIRGQDRNQKPTDRVGAFFEGLCKYARYGKFEVQGLLRNGDLLNSASANVICSLSFDRDEDFFAAAGVSKRIKIFDFHRLLDDSIDIHYPVVEMSSKSKLSCICWNSYIKNYMASTDYDGVVQLWDANTGQGFAQFAEHERRAWSVDFSQVDPKKLASGGDDCSVKLWTINERKSVGSIRNVANVCCVQFSAHSTYLLAFGSADYKTYCYDLRHTRIPWCTLAGHGKTVSYVKFLDEETIASASTDNTLKLWDLNKTSSSTLSTSACSLTFRGHTNEKNFVGLAVSDDGYIACGSETNEVYAYYKSLPMPITSHKFGSIDPISGKESNEDYGQFVSSVCWRKKSNTVVASNSSGTIKLLQMV